MLQMLWSFFVCTECVCVYLLICVYVCSFLSVLFVVFLLILLIFLLVLYIFLLI